MVGQQQILSETDKLKSNVSSLLSDVQTDEMGEDTLLVLERGQKKAEDGVVIFHCKFIK